MNDIVHIYEVKKEINPELIEAAKTLLAMCEAGEATRITIIAEMHDSVWQKTVGPVDKFTAAGIYFDMAMKTLGYRTETE